MKTPTLATAFCVLALSWACNQQNNPGNEPAGEENVPGAAERAAPTAGVPSCPVEVTGTSVALTEPEGAVAFTFTTDQGNVQVLQKSVQDMADRIQRRNERRARRDNDQAGGGGMGGGMPAATAAVEPMDNGARLTLTPQDPKDLDQLRDHARKQEEHMASGKCGNLDDYGS